MFHDDEFKSQEYSDGGIVPADISTTNNAIVEDELIDIPNEYYHSRRDYFSASMLKELIKNPYTYFNPLEREDKDAFDIGNAIHCLILEPHKFDKEFAIAPKVDRRTSKGKKTLEEFMEANKDKTVLKHEDGENCLAMAKSALEIDAVKAILLDCTFEKSIFKTIEVEIDGEIIPINAKVRYDAGNEQKSMIADVKTCDDSSPRAFKKEIAKWLYHVQDAWYTKVLGYNNFVFIAISKKPPYMVGLYVLSPIDKELGWELCVKAIKRSFTPIEKKDRLYKAKDGSIIQTITLPSYAHYDNEDI